MGSSLARPPDDQQWTRRRGADWTGQESKLQCGQSAVLCAPPRAYRNKWPLLSMVRHAETMGPAHHGAESGMTLWLDDVQVTGLPQMARQATLRWQRQMFTQVVAHSAHKPARTGRYPRPGGGGRHPAPPGRNSDAQPLTQVQVVSSGQAARGCSTGFVPADLLVGDGPRWIGRDN